MTTTYEVPLTPDPQTFNIILGITEYALTLYWNPADEGGWILDIADAKSENPVWITRGAWSDLIRDIIRVLRIGV